MKKVPINILLSGAGRWAKKNSPHILTAVGLAGMLSAIVTAVKVTPKAKELIDRAEEEKGDKLTLVEKVKTAGKLYIAPAACATIGGVCVVGADIANTKQNAGLATAAAVAETALRTYQENVIESVGAQEEKKIREKAREDISQNQTMPAAATYIFGGEKVHCVDQFGHAFDVDPDDIDRGLNAFNKELNEHDYGTLNELYDSIPNSNVSPTTAGEYIGFNIKYGHVSREFVPRLGENNRPELLVIFKPWPKRGFDRCD